MCLGCIHDYACPKASADEECGCTDTESMLAVIPRPLPEAVESARLIQEWYRSFPVGGPLHVQLDDFNLDADRGDGVDYMGETMLEGGWSLYADERTPELDALGKRIVALMQPLDEAQRGIAVGIAHYPDLAEWARLGA